MIFTSENVSVNLHTHETLTRARQWLINEGWSKGAMSDNGWCIVGAITAVTDEEYGEEVSIRIQNLLAHQLHLLLSPKEFAELMPKFGVKPDRHDHLCSNCPDIVAYNDRPATEFNDILRLIDLGIAQIDSKIANPCKCDFETVVVAVDWLSALAVSPQADGAELVVV